MPKRGHRIVCSAIRSRAGHIICGVRHYDMIMHCQIDARSDGKEFHHRSGLDQGFLDNMGIYCTRTQALAITEAAGQIIEKHAPKDKLTSEDVW